MDQVNCGLVKASAVVFMCVCISGIADGQSYHALAVPPDKVRTIAIDGNVSEWNWIPREYMVVTEDLVDVISNASVDTLDFSCSVFIAWSDITNKIYIIAEVYDDFRSVDQTATAWEYWLDDTMEFAVNASTAEQQHEGSRGWYPHTIKAHISFPLTDLNRELGVDIGPTWMQEGGHIRYGKATRKVRNNLYKSTYEIEMTLWDEWDKLGPEISKPHRLKSNETFRMSIAFDDVDMVNDKREAQWATFSPANWHTHSDYFSLFTLDPPFRKTLLKGIELIVK